MITKTHLVRTLAAAAVLAATLGVSLEAQARSTNLLNRQSIDCSQWSASDPQMAVYCPADHDPGTGSAN